MRGQGYVELKRVKADDSHEVALMKTIYNICATGLNVGRDHLSKAQRGALYERISHLHQHISLSEDK